MKPVTYKLTLNDGTTAYIEATIDVDRHTFEYVRRYFEEFVSGSPDGRLIRGIEVIDEKATSDEDESSDATPEWRSGGQSFATRANLCVITIQLLTSVLLFIPALVDRV